MSRLMLTVTGALVLLLAAGCGGGHKRSAKVVPLPEQPATTAQMTEGELVAEFHRLYPDAEKRAAELMDADATAVDDLTAELVTEDELGRPLDPPRVRLSFTATNFADYDNDGAVGISDITPLAQRYGMEYDDAPPPDDLLSERTTLGHPDTRHNRLVAGADGSGNGTVDIADITPLAMNYNAELAGYNIYRAEVVDSLLTFDEVSLPNLLSGASELSVALDEWAEMEESQSGLGAGITGRYVITLETEAPPEGEVFGFRAHAFGDDEEGPSGNVATVGWPSEKDTMPPLWLGTAGITGAHGLHMKVEVQWGKAVDVESPPVHYRIYYSPGEELDWESAAIIDDVTSPYEIHDLTPEEVYTFGVRAYDSSPAANEDGNCVTTQATSRIDTSPPEDPVIEVAHVPGNGTVGFSWTESNDELSGIARYVLTYRVLDKRPGRVISGYLFDYDEKPLPESTMMDLSPDTLEYEFSGLTDGDYVVACVEAVNGAGLANEDRYFAGTKVIGAKLHSLPQSPDPEHPLQSCVGVARFSGEPKTVYFSSIYDAGVFRVYLADGRFGKELQQVPIEIHKRAYSNRELALTPEGLYTIDYFEPEPFIQIIKLVHIGYDGTVTYETLPKGAELARLWFQIGYVDNEPLLSSAVYTSIEGWPLAGLPAIYWRDDGKWQITTAITLDARGIPLTIAETPLGVPHLDENGRAHILLGDYYMYMYAAVVDLESGNHEIVPPMPFYESGDILLSGNGSSLRLVHAPCSSYPTELWPQIDEYAYNGSDYTLDRHIGLDELAEVIPDLDYVDLVRLLPALEGYLIIHYGRVLSNVRRHQNLRLYSIVHVAPDGSMELWYQGGAKPDGWLPQIAAKEDLTVFPYFAGTWEQRKTLMHF